MQLSDLTIRIIILFFPGIICSALIDQLTVHKDRTTWIVVVHSFLLGMTCYFVLYLTAGLLGAVNLLFGVPIVPTVVFFDALVNPTVKPEWIEIFWATLFSVPIAFLTSWLAGHKVLHRFAQSVGATNKFGDLDVWDFLFNSPDVHWIVVRDIKNDLSFYGWVQAFSDTVDKPELFLRDVNVNRNSTGEFLYQVGGLYLSRMTNEITIEIADLGYNVSNHNGEKVDG